MHDFFEQVESLQQSYATILCLGLDPRPHYLTEADRQAENPLAAWGERMLRETADYICCVKPNSAFYEAQGSYGWEALKQTIAIAHEIGIPVLLDAKRGDIGSTAEAHAVAAFHELEADAITLSPYLGRDTMQPFLKVAGRGLFVLCHTSNPSADDVQLLDVQGRSLYEVVAERATQWSDRIGLVVGATYPHAIAAVREAAPEAWLLLPGVGAQGADEKAAIAAAGQRMIVPVSRGIIAADDPRQAARELRDKLNRAADRSVAAPAPALSRRQQAVAETLLSIGAVRFGQFTLASGAQSPFYIDLRLLASHPRALSLVARAIGDLIAEKALDFDVLAALPYGALPIGVAVSLQSGDPLIYPRKEVKGYGTQRQIEGIYEAGQVALVLDDLVTTGGTKVKGAEPLRHAGLTVNDIVVLIDRSVGGAATELATHGMALHAVLTMEAMIDHLATQDLISAEQRKTVARYLAG